MAFAFNASLSEVEYRACRHGTSNASGRTWMSLIFEDYDATQIECSVPQDMQGDIFSMELKRGDVCDIAIRAVARADGNSYVQLVALPLVYEKDE